MDDNEWSLIALVLLFFGLIIGGLITFALKPDAGLTANDSVQGIPIHDMSLSDDGLTLAFYIGEDQWQANMATAISRPPNMATAITMFIEGDQLLFLTTDNKSFFGDAIHYSGSLLRLTG